MTRLAPLTALLVLLAAPAWAAQEDTTPGGDASLGFPIALGVLLVTAVVLALVWRAVSKRKQEADR